MAKLQLVTGTTSYIAQVFIQDSSSTTGAGLTGLTNASSGLTAYYHRDTDTTATAISLVTMTVGTFTSSGFKEIDATNMPGWYQLCPPNAALASGAKSCAIHLKGATNMAPLPLEIELTAVNNQDATKFGMTRVVANVDQIDGASWSTHAAGMAPADVRDIAGAAVSTSSAQLGVNVVNIAGAAAQVDANNLLKVDVEDYKGTAISATATAGLPDVNVKNINAVAATSVTTVNANIGTTQPINFTGTAGSALVKSDAVDIAGAAVSTSSAQIGVNVVNFGGAAGTFAGGRPEVDLNSAANTELGAVPASTAKTLDMIKWLYLLARNKITQTSTTTLVKANDGSTTVGTSTISDDGTTFTRGAMS